MIPSDFTYEKVDNGQYVLRGPDGKQVMQTDCPAVLFDRDSGTLYKHGDYQRIKKLAADMRAKYLRVSAGKLANDLVVWGSKNFDVDELNKCLCIAGYCKLFYDRMSTQ